MPEELVAEIKGRDLVSGLPKTITISAGGDPSRDRGAGERDHRRHQDHARPHAPRARPRTSWTAASCSPAAAPCSAGSTSACATRPACPCASPTRRCRRWCSGSGQVPRGVRGAAAGPGEPEHPPVAAWRSRAAAPRSDAAPGRRFGLGLASLVITLDYRQGATGPLAGVGARGEVGDGADATRRDDGDRAGRRLLLGPRQPALARRRERAPPGARSTRSQAQHGLRCLRCRAQTRRLLGAHGPAGDARSRGRPGRRDRATASRTSSGHDHDRQGVERRHRGRPCRSSTGSPGSARLVGRVVAVTPTSSDRAS